MHLLRYYIIKKRSGRMVNIDLNELIAKSDALPIFAEEVGVLMRVKAAQNEKKELHKEGLVSIVFIDTVRQRIIGEFVLNQITAIALRQILDDTLKKLNDELKSKELPKAPEAPRTSNMSYR